MGRGAVGHGSGEAQGHKVQRRQRDAGPQGAAASGHAAAKHGGGGAKVTRCSGGRARCLMEQGGRTRRRQSARE